MDFSGGVKHWDKCKLGTALERVVFTSSRTARLELTKVLETVERIGNDFSLGLRITGGLTFGPKPSVVEIF